MGRDVTLTAARYIDAVTRDARDEEKRRAAEHAAAMVEDGMRLGLGSGTTAALVVRALGTRVRAGMRLAHVVSSSSATTRLAEQEGITVGALDAAPLDLVIDGADEVDPALRMIKGGGGALLREKVIAHAATRVVIAVDASKRVETLGRFPLPLEVLPFAMGLVLRTIADLAPRVRLAPDGSEARTDQGNALVDCSLGRIDDPEALARRLEAIPGVIEHGLFLREAELVVVGVGERVDVLRRRS